MRDATGQLAHRLDFLAVPQRFFSLPPCGGFHGLGDDGGDPCLMIEQGAEGEIERALAGRQAQFQFVARRRARRSLQDGGADHAGNAGRVGEPRRFAVQVAAHVLLVGQDGGQ
ncbi:hypothetical protein D3C71_1508760 [compost metagenome]